METKSLCHICGSVASKTCKLCGRSTCPVHIKDGICASCAAGRK